MTGLWGDGAGDDGVLWMQEPQGWTQQTSRSRGSGPIPALMEPLVASDEPKRDIARMDAWAWTLGMLLVLGGSAVGFRATSLPLVSLGLAVLPAVGPLRRSSDLPVVRYAATTVASVNGTLLVFLASLAFGVAATAGTKIAEADTRWMLIVAIAAGVSSAGTGVLVRRAQLMEVHERWVRSQLLARTHGSHDVVDSAAAGPHRAGRILAAALAAIVLFRFTRRRS